MPRMPRAAFSQIANRSMSEVLTRSLATSLCTALPILALMLFGGETLRDFAFALLIGVISGAYSSVFIATPVLTAWKEREPVYEARRERIELANGGIVPPYALAVGSEPVDVEPEEQPRAPRRRLTTPDEPGELSREEFEALQRDLDIDDDAAVAPPRRGRAAAVVPPPSAGTAPAASPKPPKATPAEPEGNGRAPDEPENDGMVQETRKPRSGGRRSRRHGRSR
jgi:SecD/SecF fusion protein